MREPKVKLDHVFSAVKRGRVSIPLNDVFDLGGLGGLPWGSIATLSSDGDRLHRIVGPAVRQPTQWVLPILETEIAPNSQLPDYEREAVRVRRTFGLETVSSW
jgi:hypothetical protein